MLDAVKYVFSALDAYGPVAVILVALGGMNGFFIWRDFKREALQMEHMDRLHKAHHEIVIPLLGECKEAIASCKEAISQNSSIITRTWNAR